MSSTKTYFSRTFLLLNKDGRNVDVEAKLYSLGRQAPYFSITSQSGSNHEEIIASAPEEVRSEIETLVALHLCDYNGTPMHAIANAKYAIQEARFEDARRSLGGGFPVELIYGVHAKVAAEIDGRAEKTPVVDALKTLFQLAAVVRRAKVAADQEKRDGASLLLTRQEAYIVAIKRYIAAMEGREYATITKSGMPGVDRKPFIDQFEKGKVFAEINLMNTSAPDAVAERVRKMVRPKIMDEALREFVKEHCEARWAEAADAGRAILSKPSYRDERRPDPSVDPKTFDGFMATHGFKFEARKIGPSKSSVFKGATEWECKLTGIWHSMTMPYHMGSGHQGAAPTVDQVLESLQMDVASIDGHSQDDWLKELGFDDSVESVRNGEKAFKAITENTAELKQLFGDAYKAFMTEVGDNPPFGPDYSWEEAAPKL